MSNTLQRNGARSSGLQATDIISKCLNIHVLVVSIYGADVKVAFPLDMCFIIEHLMGLKVIALSVLNGPLNERLDRKECVDVLSW